MDSHIISKSGQAPVARAEIVPRILAGEIVVLPRALDVFGVRAQIAQLTLKTIEDQCGVAPAAEVERAGFEKIHNVLNGEQIERLYAGVRHRLVPNMPPVIKAIGEHLMGLEAPFYINSNCVVRFFVPHSHLQASYATFKQHLGKLDLHGPHHDIYQDVALNAINLWMAVGEVEKENGLGIFTDVWGRTLPQGVSHVRDDQYLGEPLLLECAPGDVVLFHAHHMHASILNSTDRTRYVVTSRLTLEPPVHPNPERRFQYLRSDLVGTVPLHEATTSEGRDATPEELADHAPDEDDVGSPVSVAATPEALGEGEIMALDEKTCVARVDGALHAFARRCTHQGADMSLGYVKEGQVHCPWHNVSFDPASGTSRCAALKPLKTQDLPADLSPCRRSQTANL